MANKAIAYFLYRLVFNNFNIKSKKIGSFSCFFVLFFIFYKDKTAIEFKFYHSLMMKTNKFVLRLPPIDEQDQTSI